jgi:DNA-binding MarR family transcriptional regulator
MTPFKRSQLQKGILNNVKDHINHMLKDENISEGQFEYFIAIHENEGINQNELASILNVNKTSVTKAMKKLLENNLIERIVDNKDQRNYGLYISEKGQYYVKLFNNINKSINSKMLSNFSEKDLKMSDIYLKKMYENSLRLKD